MKEATSVPAALGPMRPSPLIPVRPALLGLTAGGSRSGNVPHPAAENIAAIVRLEEEADRGRSRSERLADAIAAFSGNLRAVLIQIVGVAVWIGVNTGAFHITPFDPYPFGLLCLLVTIEAVLLATFVLIKQNRMSRRADERGHLALQVNLLVEQETTKVLQLVDRIVARLNIEQTDPESDKLREDTEIERLAHAVKAQFSAE
jgi:uncharacterized membrane protein